MADEESKQAGKGFTVQDRRRFSPDTGEAREEAPEQSEAQPKSSEERREASGATSSETLPEINFSTFVIGLSTQALMHLGEIPDPMHQRITHDLPAAKQMIDLLGILRDKTKGNLDAAEEQLLGEVLYDLRMRYVEVARAR